jgi:hypothetical protein
MKTKSLRWSASGLAAFLVIGLVACPNPTVVPDNDGIPDSAEVPGSTFGGLDLYAMGARVGQRDIFIELDNMTSSAPALNPQRAALDKFVAAFATKNIVLHIDAGDAFSPTFDPANYNLGNAQRLLPFSQSMTLTPKAGFSSVQEFKNQYFAANRSQIFYYMVLGSSQNANGTAGSSGLAEIIGSNSMVSFGGWSLNTSSPAKTNQLINIMASTMMHEFGHNLGLRHGGDENKNYKPNYVSIMNYMYQLDCIGPTTGPSIADRYFYNLNSSKYPESSMVNNARTDTCSIDYSNGSSSSLNENTLNENDGMGRGAGFVDWNDNGTAQTNLSFNLNPDSDTVKDTLTDYDDWKNIQLGFANLGNGNVRPQNTIQEISDESPPNPSFLEHLAKDHQ